MPVQSQVEAPQTHAQSQPAPIYEMKYVDGGNDTIANLSQANVATDRDHFSDGTAEFDELTHVPSDQPIADMLAMAEEHNPTATLPPGESVEYWTLRRYRATGIDRCRRDGGADDRAWPVREWRIAASRDRRAGTGGRRSIPCRSHLFAMRQVRARPGRGNRRQQPFQRRLDRGSQ